HDRWVKAAVAQAAKDMHVEALPGVDHDEVERAVAVEVARKQPGALPPQQVRSLPPLDASRAQGRGYEVEDWASDVVLEPHEVVDAVAVEVVEGGLADPPQGAR